LIQEHRRQKKLTQSQLAEGICSRETISRIENSTRRPDWILFQNIMTRLDVCPRLYHSDIADEHEMFIIEKFHEWKRAMANFDMVALKTALENHEKDPRFAAGLGAQCLLYLKVLVFQQGPYADAVKAHEAALSYLKRTRPDFDIEKIPGYFLSLFEIAMLNNLAIIQRTLSGEASAAALLTRLLDNLNGNKQYAVLHDYDKMQLLFNFTASLLRLCRYEECLAQCDQGMHLAAAHRNPISFMHFVSTKADCLVQLGRTEEGSVLHERNLHFHYSLDGFAEFNFEEAKMNYETLYKKQPDLSVAW